MKLSHFTTATLLIASTALAGYGLAKTTTPKADEAQPQAAQAQADQAQPQAEQSAFLGVGVTPVDADTAKLLGTTRGTGLIVGQLADDGPAVAAGLQVGDVITKLNDQLLINPEQLAVLVRTFDPGQTVTLHVLREGEPVTIKAKLAGRVLPELGPGGMPMDRMHAPQPADPFDELQGLMGPGGQPMIGPENLDQFMQQIQQRITSQRGDMEQMLRQMMQEQLQQGGAGALPPDVQQGLAGLNVQAEQTWSDGEHTLQLKTNGQDRMLKITDRDGKVLFDGKVPENGQIDGLPNGVQQKVDQMLKGNAIQFRIAPPPQPKEHGPVA